jgi:hypothetical protein
MREQDTTINRGQAAVSALLLFSFGKSGRPGLPAVAYIVDSLVATASRPVERQFTLQIASTQLLI